MKNKIEVESEQSVSLGSILPAFQSVTDCATHLQETHQHILRGLYRVSIKRSPKIEMNERGRDVATSIMKAPCEDIERQTIVTISDLLLQRESVINPLRSRRVAQPSGSEAVDLIDQERELNGCPFCDRGECGWHVQHRGLWVEEFGEIRSEDGRIGAWPNWARQAPINGIVLGDERMHNYLKLAEADWVSLFDIAEVYVRRAHQHDSEAAYFMVIFNGGPKSAGSVAHAHLQVVGRSDSHFPYPDHVATLSRDYWNRAEAVHEELGLTFRNDQCVAWANIAPFKERDVCVISPSLHTGAKFVYQLLNVLKQHGTNSFSLAAILSPGYVTGQNLAGRFAEWPSVVWRLIDRGDLRSRHADWGTLEIMYSSVVASDPFLVAQWLKAFGA